MLPGMPTRAIPRPAAHHLTVGDVTVEVVRKDVKNWNLRVYAPDGRVRIAVPRHVDDDAVRQIVAGRLAWIKRQQGKFQARPQQPAREYVSGESHSFLGNTYRLNVIEQDGPPHVVMRDKSTLDLYVRPGSSPAQREQVLLGWQRRQLKALIPALIAKWEPVLGVQVAEWGIKRMRTRWGTCNIRARRIWLNLELARHPAPCLEYVVVHEMVHLLERTHNAVFQAHMTRALPHWRELCAQLNQAQPGRQDWEC